MNLNSHQIRSAIPTILHAAPYCKGQVRKTLWNKIKNSSDYDPHLIRLFNDGRNAGGISSIFKSAHSPLSKFNNSREIFSAEIIAEMSSPSTDHCNDSIFLLI